MKTAGSLPVRIATYSRVSTPRQSPENQLVQLRRWAADHAHQVVAEFVDVAPGDSQNRPAIRQMVERRAEFDAVVIVRPDRLARCSRVFDAITSQLPPVVTVEACNQADAITIAEEEHRLLRERTRAGLERAKADGVKLGRPRRITVAQRLAPRLAAAAAGMLRLQAEKRTS